MSRSSRDTRSIVPESGQSHHQPPLLLPALLISDGNFRNITPNDNSYCIVVSNTASSDKTSSERGIFIAMGHNILTATTVDGAGTGTGAADVFGVDLGTISVWDDDGVSAQDNKVNGAVKQAIDITNTSAFSPRQERRCSDESSSEDFPFRSPDYDTPFFPTSSPSGRDSSRKLIGSLGPGPLSPVSRSRQSVGSPARHAFDNECQVANGFLTPAGVKTKKVLSSQDRLHSSHGPMSSSWDATDFRFASSSPGSREHMFPVEWKADPLDEFVESRTPSARRRSLSNELKAAVAQSPYRDPGRVVNVRPRSRRASMGSVGDGQALPLGRIARPARVARKISDSQVELKVPRPNRAIRSSSYRVRRSGRLISADEWGSAVSTLNALFQSSNPSRTTTGKTMESPKFSANSQRRSPSPAPTAPRSPKQSSGSNQRRCASPLSTTPRKALSQPSPSRRRSSSRNRPNKDGSTAPSGLPLAPTLANNSEVNKEEKDSKAPRRPSLAGRKIKYEKKTIDDCSNDANSATSGKKSVRSRSSRGSKNSKGTISRRRSSSRARDAIAISDDPNSPKREHSPTLPPQTPRSERAKRRSSLNAGATDCSKWDTMVVADSPNSPNRELPPSLPPQTPRSERTTRRSLNVTDSTKPPICMNTGGVSPSKKLVSPSPRRKIKYVSPSRGKNTYSSPKLDDSRKDALHGELRTKIPRRLSNK